jgi:urease accessory protein
MTLAMTRPASPTTDADPWLLWQLADSAFPSGGFAHAAGLEAACAGGLVRDAEQLPAFARAILRQQTCAALPLLRAAHEARTLDRLFPVDQLAEALLTNHVAHRASRAMGRALARAADGAFAHPALEQLDHALRRGQTPGHLPPTFGYLAGQLHIPLRDAAHLFLFQTLRSVLSAAVRLGLLGPLHAQRLTHQLAPDAHDAAARGLTIPLDHAAETNPLLSLMQSNQDRIYSRLFQS